MKITKKERKAQKQLAIQRKRVTVIEDFMIEHVDPVECPITHHFTNNEQTELNTYCREMFVPAGTILTGVIYKIEVFWVMTEGKMRLIEGDHTREIEAPCLLKNVVGTKNCGYAYTDCRFFGVVPNPQNLRNLEDVISIFSATPANEVQGMPGNKQKMNYEKRLTHEVA